MSENSVGNITEILQLLDKEVYSGEEIKANYDLLVEKWGEWEVVGEENSNFTIRYINIGNALFSGLMMTYLSFTIASFCAAIILGKIVFPLLVKMYKNNNDEMVDLATLKSASQIDAMTKKAGKEWF